MRSFLLAFSSAFLMSMIVYVFPVFAGCGVEHNLKSADSGDQVVAQTPTPIKRKGKQGN